MSSAIDTAHNNPFPGLRPFNEDEVHLFFGRESQVDAMVDKLAATRFLAVVGTSGSGKSSLVNCGLRPALLGGLLARAGSAWRVAQFRPGSDPLGEMARTLAKDGVLFSDHEASGLPLSDIIDTTLCMSKLGLVDIVQQARLAKGTNLLLVVDQFEELFRYRQSGTDDDGANEVKDKHANSSEQATAFINLLLEAATQKTLPIYVVLTMRSDFLGDCALLPGLAEAINAGQYLVPRMSRDERRAAIKGPISVAGGAISPLLLTRLVNDVGDNPDQLSILQHALNRSWAYWQHEGSGDGPLALTHYQAIGSMAHALDQHAHKAYEELTSEHQRQICEKIFKALTDKATDPRGIRRPTPMGTLCVLAAATLAEVTKVIEVFRKPSRSFLMPPAGEALLQETMIDISHESLMRVWQRLNNWADEEAQAAQGYRRLAETAQLHDTGKASLWRDPELQVILDWREHSQPNETWATRYHLGFAQAMDFLNMSRDAREAEGEARSAQRQREHEAEQEKAEAQVKYAQREREFQVEQEKAQAQAKHARRMRWVALFSGALAIVALISSAWAYNASQQAQVARNVAEGARQDAVKAQKSSLRTLSLMHASLSREHTQKGNATLGILLALQALPEDMEPLPQAQSALHGALNALRERSILNGHESDVTSAHFSPDGSQVLTASYDKTARLWDVASGKELTVLTGHKSIVYSAHFSPDGSQVVTASGDKTARLWDVASGQELAVLKGHEDRVISAHFSPDGKQVVTASGDKTARLWDVASGQKLAVLTGHEDRVTSAHFSPDGSQVVTASEDKTARLWDVASGKELTVLTGHKSILISAHFSPDGSQVVTASDDNTARLWDVASGRELAVLIGHESVVRSAHFSPDGSQVVTASWDNTARLWDVASGQELAVLRGHESDVTSAYFSPDGSQVVTASGDNAARLWDVASGKELTVLRGHNSYVTSAHFSPDGSQVVTASGDRTARLWDVASGKELTVLRGHESDVISAHFSPDGSQVVTASEDKTARLWDVASGQELAVLTGHEKVVYSAHFSPDGKQVVTASADKTARLWDVASGQELAVLRGHGSDVTSAAFSPDGSQVVTASEDKTARLWDVASGQELAVLTGHEDSVTSAAFSPDGKQVVTASGDRTARLWDVASGKELTVLRGHESDVRSAHFSPNGSQVVTASADKTARLWDVASGQELAVLIGHENGIISAHFSPNGKQVVTASYDKTARIWDVTSGQERAVLRGHERQVFSAHFSPDGSQVLTASYDSTARLWDNPTLDELIERAKKRLPRQEMTKAEKEEFFVSNN
jgi:WD40 repeat protein